jgi:hypothetical protein
VLQEDPCLPEVFSFSSSVSHLFLLWIEVSFLNYSQNRCPTFWQASLFLKVICPFQFLAFCLCFYKLFFFES